MLQRAWPVSLRVLLKFGIKVQLQNNGLQIGPHAQNASHWFRTMYAASGLGITFIYLEQEVFRP